MVGRGGERVNVRIDGGRKACQTADGPGVGQTGMEMGDGRTNRGGTDGQTPVELGRGNTVEKRETVGCMGRERMPGRLKDRGRTDQAGNRQRMDRPNPNLEDSRAWGPYHRQRSNDRRSMQQKDYIKEVGGWQIDGQRIGAADGRVGVGAGKHGGIVLEKSSQPQPYAEMGH